MRTLLRGLTSLFRKRGVGEAPTALLGVVAPPAERPLWLVPLTPIEDEEYAWELEYERRKDMEKNA